MGTAYDNGNTDSWTNLVLNGIFTISKFFSWNIFNSEIQFKYLGLKIMCKGFFMAQILFLHTIIEGQQNYLAYFDQKYQHFFYMIWVPRQITHRCDVLISSIKLWRGGYLIMFLWR